MVKRFLTGVVIALTPVFLSAQIATQSQTAKDYFDQGLAHLREHRFEQALASFEQSARLDDKQPATFANIGSIEMALRRPDRAEAAFRAAIRITPSEASFHTALCGALGAQKKFQAAIGACEEGVRLAPDSEHAHSARLDILRLSGRSIPELQPLIDHAVSRFRTSELILMYAADFYIYIREFTQAVTLLESLVSMCPETAKYHGVLAEVYLRLGRDADSLASARAAIKLNPQSPYANYAMGLIFFELGQHDETIESLSKVVSDDPRLIYADYYRALSEARRGNHAVATDILRKLVNQSPDNPDFQLQLGMNLSDRHLYADAESAFLKVMSLTPKTAELHSHLGMTYMMRGQFEKAIPQFDEALRLKPGTETFRMFLKVSRERQNLVPQIPEMIRDVESNPKDVKKRFELARALGFVNRMDEADEHINALYALNPDDPLIYVWIGIAFCENGRFEKAVEAYLKSIEKKQNPAAYFNLGDAYARLGRFDAAGAAYTKGIELKPDTPNFMKSFGDLLLHHGKRREALEMYKRSLALLPNNPVVLFDAGLLSAKFGDRTAAQAYLATLRTLDSQLARKLEFCLRIWN